MPFVLLKRMPMPQTAGKQKLKIGETLSLRVESLNSGGRGVAFLDEQPIFIKEGLPGDQVTVQLTRVRPDLIEAKLLQVEIPSPDRVAARCQHFGPCGGCDLQHFNYPAQVGWKAKALEKILRQEVAFKVLPPVEVVAMEDPWGYRSKMEFSFGQEGPRVTLGLHQRGSFQRIVDIARCHIAPAGVSELLCAIKEVANQFPSKAYNPKIHQGFWRYAVIRSSLIQGQMMLLVVTNEGPKEPIDALAAELPKRVPSLKSFYWGISTKVSDVSQPERMSCVAGCDFIEDRVGDLRFRIRPTNFVQPNLVLVSRIYESIKTAARLTGREAVYDLYCGIGLIALTLARQSQVVYAVESESENVSLAEQNAALNGISNTTFLCGKVEDLIKGRALFKAGPKPDCIVLDPPRAGLHKEVYAPLLEAKAPTVLYLSCNPVSLSRDLKVLLERDPRYQVESIQLFDFFPHTTHIETLVTLRRQT